MMHQKDFYNYDTLRETPQEREESDFYTVRTIGRYANNIGRGGHSPTCALALLRRAAAVATGRVEMKDFEKEVAAAELTGIDTGRLKHLEEASEVAARANLTLAVLIDTLNQARSAVFGRNEFALRIDDESKDGTSIFSQVRFRSTRR